MIGALLVFISALPVLVQSEGRTRGVSSIIFADYFGETQLAFAEIAKRRRVKARYVSTVFLPCSIRTISYGPGDDGDGVRMWYESMAFEHGHKPLLCLRAPTRETAMENHWHLVDEMEQA